MVVIAAANVGSHPVAWNIPSCRATKQQQLRHCNERKCPDTLLVSRMSRCPCAYTVDFKYHIFVDMFTGATPRELWNRS